MAAQRERARCDPVALAPCFTATLRPSDPIRIGIVVFDEDTTTEEVIAWLGLSELGVAVHVARMPLPLDVSEAGLYKAAAELEAAGRQLVPSTYLNAIAYSCTIGALELGLPRVIAALTRGREGVAVATPITAAVSAFRALGVRKMALLTPYGQARNHLIVSHLAAAGLEVVSGGAFEAVAEVDYARISHDALRSASLQACAPDADALFISCTALRGTDLIPELEARLGRPVVTSTQAMLWEALRLAGETAPIVKGGRLFSH